VWFVRRRAVMFRSNEAIRRRHAAYRTARHALQPTNGSLSAGQARSALVGYIADKCAMPSGGLTRGDAVRTLKERGFPEETVQRVDGLLEALEQSEYGGERANVDASDAGDLIDALERGGLR